MNALRGVRRGMTGQRGGRKCLKSELASAFSSYSKKKKTCVWKHRFVCLGLRDQPRIPTTDVEKDDLLTAGLGEKVVEFPCLEASGEEMNEVLYSTVRLLHQQRNVLHFKTILDKKMKLINLYHNSRAPQSISSNMLITCILHVPNHLPQLKE